MHISFKKLVFGYVSFLLVNSLSIKFRTTIYSGAVALCCVIPDVIAECLVSGLAEFSVLCIPVFLAELSFS